MNTSNPSKSSLYRLGKLPARFDERTIRLASVLKPQISLPLPEHWDFDSDVAGKPVPLPMFANDRVGDCVIAGRAHMSLRFELFEQGIVLPILDGEVLKEYQAEGGSMDPDRGGLVMLDSLKAWRSQGWKIGTQIYKIHAFLELARGSEKETATAIRYLNGAYIGLALPDCFMEQFQKGLPWDLVSGPAGRPNPSNGHCVYLCGYNVQGPVCVTWGKKQQMTWRFYAACCDEAYAIADDRDAFVKNSPVDLAKLDQLLAALH